MNGKVEGTGLTSGRFKFEELNGEITLVFWSKKMSMSLSSVSLSVSWEVFADFDQTRSDWIGRDPLLCFSTPSLYYYYFFFFRRLIKPVKIPSWNQTQWGVGPGLPSSLACCTDPRPRELVWVVEVSGSGWFIRKYLVWCRYWEE